ncbi:MAG: hypothetical protein AAB946_01510, partial [Patescibacteria group bacterium]
MTATTTSLSGNLNITGNVSTGTWQATAIDATYLDANAVMDNTAEAITGVWEIADDINFDFGTDADWHLEYDEGVDNQLLFTTTQTAAVAVTDPLFEILVGTTPTADQQVFGVAKGTQASNTPLFTLDEGGDAVFAGTIAGSNLSGTNTGDQNLWATISSQSGSTAANSTTDTLTINGGGIATTAVSGDTLTVTATEADTLSAVVGRNATTTTLVNLDGGIATDTNNFTVSGTTGAIGVVGALTTGNTLGISFDAATQTGNISGVDIDFTNITDAANNLYGVHVNDAAGTSSTAYGVYVEGTNWDYGIYSADDIYTATDLTVAGG